MFMAAAQLREILNCFKIKRNIFIRMYVEKITIGSHYGITVFFTQAITEVITALRHYGITALRHYGITALRHYGITALRKSLRYVEKIIIGSRYGEKKG